MATVLHSQSKPRMSLYLSVNDKLSVMTSSMKCPQITSWEHKQIHLSAPNLHSSCSLVSIHSQYQLSCHSVYCCQYGNKTSLVSLDILWFFFFIILIFFSISYENKIPKFTVAVLWSPPPPNIPEFCYLNKLKHQTDSYMYVTLHHKTTKKLQDMDFSVKGIHVVQ